MPPCLSAVVNGRYATVVTGQEHRVRLSWGCIYGLLRELLTAGLIVLLVEQDVSQALRGVSRAQGLLEGTTTLEGSPGGTDCGADRVHQEPALGVAPTTARRVRPGGCRPHRRLTWSMPFCVVAGPEFRWALVHYKRVRAGYCPITARALRAPWVWCAPTAEVRWVSVWLHRQGHLPM